MVFCKYREKKSYTSNRVEFGQKNASFGEIFVAQPNHLFAGFDFFRIESTQRLLAEASFLERRNLA